MFGFGMSFRVTFRKNEDQIHVQCEKTSGIGVELYVSRRINFFPVGG